MRVTVAHRIVNWRWEPLNTAGAGGILVVKGGAVTCRAVTRGVAGQGSRAVAVLRPWRTRIVAASSLVILGVVGRQNSTHSVPTYATDTIPPE